MSRNYEEYRLQIAAVDYLRGQRWEGKNCYPITVPFPDFVFTATSFEGRSAAEGYKRKRMGVRAGVWDIIGWWNGAPGKGIFEAKTINGVLSNEQKNFEADFKRAGGVSGIFRSVEEFRDILISLGLKCYNMSVAPPKISTAQKQKLAFDFYKP